MIPLLVICAIFIVIGIFLSKRVSTASDFFIAGRGMPLFVLSFTIAATHFGGGALVGGVQQGAELGLWAGMYAIIGYAIACFVNAAIAPRFRRLSGNLTPPDYVEARYGASKFLRGYHTAVYMLGTIAIIAVQFNAFGGMAQGFGISRPVAIVIGAITIIIYTGMAGMWGVAVTDVLQLVICMIFLPLVAILSMLSLTNTLDISVGQLFQQPFFANTQAAHSFLYSLIPTIIGSVFAYEYYLRYQSAKSEKDARISSIIGGILLLAMALPVGLIGSVAHTLYPNVPSHAVLGHVANLALPPWAAIIFLAAVLAAILSTADSMMTSLSSMVTRDIYHKLFHPGMDFDRLPHSMKLARISAVAGALIAMLISLQFNSIIGLLFWTSPLQSGVLFAPIIGGMFWKGANRTGAYAAIICGALTALLEMFGLVVWPERMLTTMAVGTVALIIGSIVSRKKQLLAV